MTKRLTMLAVSFLLAGCLSWAAGKTFVGTVSDEHCGAKHAKAGDAAAQCVAKCAGGGAKYVLVSHAKVYKLDPQDKFADYAGKSVKVMGKLSGDTITVDTVEAAGAPAPRAIASAMTVQRLTSSPPARSPCSGRAGRSRLARSPRCSRGGRG